ncbi:hypothetical protein ABZP36_033657 [Zizania latifolia]
MAVLLGGVKAVLLLVVFVLLAVTLYSPGGFSPAPMPAEYSYGTVVSVPRHETRALAASERVREGRLPAPEDLAYNAAGGWLYTGCADRWVRRVSVAGGDVDLGATDGVTVSPDKTVELPTDQAEGIKFALTRARGNMVIYL